MFFNGGVPFFFFPFKLHTIEYNTRFKRSKKNKQTMDSDGDCPRRQVDAQNSLTVTLIFVALLHHSGSDLGSDDDDGTSLNTKLTKTEYRKRNRKRLKAKIIFQTILIIIIIFTLILQLFGELRKQTYELYNDDEVTWFARTVASSS